MTIILTGDHPAEYKNYIVNQDIDARTATFHQKQASNGDYPFNIRGASAPSGLLFLGGKVLGGVPHGDWRTLYEGTYGNSAAVRIEDCPGAIIDGWTFEPDPALSGARFVWDAIRTNGSTDNWIVQNILMNGCRDDALEMEHGSGGTVRDSRFFDCFVFLGTHGLNAGSKTIAIENCLVSMGLYFYKGAQTHQSPFKANTDNPSFNPSFVLDNVVIAIRDPNHEGGAGTGSRLAVAFARMTATNCHFLNLSDTPLPSGYPARPAGFTTLQGQAARDYWNQRVAAWGQEEGWMPTQAEWDALVARVTALEGEAPDVTQAELDAVSARVAAAESAITAHEGRLDAISSGSAG